MANPHPIPRPIVEGPPFQPQDAIKSGMRGALVGGSTGLFFSAVANSLARENVGAMGVFTRTGGMISYSTVCLGLYFFSKDATANLRRKDDVLNSAVGGFLGGGVLGLKGGRIPSVLGWGTAMAVTMSAYNYLGGSIYGYRPDPDADRYEEKEYLRKNRRRPIEETISELGEGRGLKPPGYEERRRQRLKEKYGVDINPVSVRAE